jgi:hypothetical protein
MEYNDLINRIPKEDMLEWNEWVKKGVHNSKIARNAIISQNGFIELSNLSILNIIHDTVQSEAMQKYALSDKVEARYFDQLKLFGILFKNECFIRINKLNRDFTICGNTNQKDSFINQGHLEGIPLEIPRLILGYFLNNTNTEITGVHLVYWHKTALWDYNISQDIVINQKRIHFYPEKEEKGIYAKYQKPKQANNL